MTGQGEPFADRPRADAREKVTGTAIYAADVPLDGMLYAMIVPAMIAKGTVSSLDDGAALRIPGVLRILKPGDCPPPPSAVQGRPPPPPMLLNEIGFHAQPVALVVAETLEAAIEGADAVRVHYDSVPFSPTLDSDGAERAAGRTVAAGDADAAMDGAVVRHRAIYSCPAQHHNPIELMSTTADWSAGMLTIHEGTQSSAMIRFGVAANLGLSPEQVVVSSPQVGGSFGQKAAPQRYTALVSYASMLLGRPVKLVVPRGQIFNNATFRPVSRHDMELGADANGRLIAIRYHAEHQQSRRGVFPPDYHEAAPQMYGVPDYLGTGDDLRIDTQTPGFMRSPYPHPAAFALESAVDELAAKLGKDPVEFRLAHDATVDPLNGRPLSSRYLKECITEGARVFGWAGRAGRSAGSMTADGTQIGFGMGCGAYPASTHAAIATLRVHADGRSRFSTAGHEIGQGICSALQQVLVREAGVDPDRLEIVIGDTSGAPQHTTAGSWGTASAVPIAKQAADELRREVERLTGTSGSNGPIGDMISAAGRDFVEVEVSRLAPGQGADALERLREGGVVAVGPQYPAFTAFSYAAHFVEVHVEASTRRVRVPRVVSVVDCGRVMSPRTAASQVRGGVVWGLGAALREVTGVDPRFGGWLNNDLADYVVSVNADIGDINVSFIDRPDPLINALGVKGLGEVAMTGVAGAVANAVHDATGRRLRSLPIRIEDLL